jgi:hypothetical protein
MALKVDKVDVWAGDLRDVPGGLADVLEQVSQGGQSIEFIIARRNDEQPGTGKVFVTPVSTTRAKDAAGRAGLQNASNVATLRVEGTDAPGLGSKITRAMADEGINVRGVSAAVIGTKFVCYVGLDSDEDANRAMGALKGISTVPGKRSAGRKKTSRASRPSGRTRTTTTAKKPKSRR